MNKGLIAAFIVAVALGVVLFTAGRNTDSQTVENQSEAPVAHDHDHDHGEHSADDMMGRIEYLRNIEDRTEGQTNELIAIYSAAKAQNLLSADQVLEYGGLMLESGQPPMQAILTIRSALDIDSNHIPTIETLGQLSIRTQQWDRAKKRYQKLLSLQPSNAAYRAQLERICAELGEKDCL